MFQKTRHVMFIIRSRSGLVKLSLGLTSALIIVDSNGGVQHEASERGLFSWKRDKLVKNKKYRNQQERLTTRDQELKISLRILRESFQNPPRIILESLKNLKTEINWPFEGQTWTKQQRLRSFWVLVQAQKVPKVMIQIKFYKKGKRDDHTIFVTLSNHFWNRNFDPRSSHFRKHQVFKLILKIHFSGQFSKYPVFEARS